MMEISKEGLTGIVLISVISGVMFTSLYYKLKGKQWKKKYKTKNGKGSFILTIGSDNKDKTFFDFVWSSMGSLFGIIFGGAILTKIILGLIN